jgi:tryptophanyl-tRNA synthetase
MSTPKNRIFSGIQPTHNLHLGNYLGAIRNWVKLQDSFDCIFCIVDLHATHGLAGPAELTHQTREVTAAYLAAGIDARSTSSSTRARWRPRPARLDLQLRARLGWLNRMTQFKEKAGKDRENVSVGLFAYPT